MCVAAGSEQLHINKNTAEYMVFEEELNEHYETISI